MSSGIKALIEEIDKYGRKMVERDIAYEWSKEKPVPDVIFEKLSISYEDTRPAGHTEYVEEFQEIRMSYYIGVFFLICWCGGEKYRHDRWEDRE
jgi:hypothetical protein